MILKDFLDQHDVSQSDFATSLGVTRAAVNHWILGKSYPSGRTAARIVELTGGQVTLAELYPSGSNVA